jgi:hypothetical protein
MAAHASVLTTQLYDRRRDDVTLDEVVKINICGRSDGAKRQYVVSVPASRRHAKAAKRWTESFQLEPMILIGHSRKDLSVGVQIIDNAATATVGPRRAEGLINVECRFE